ncbi:MAG TPA: hypothetical protein DEH25_04925 [Chloroflexi bacterium]|nr:hypothetical protein [Chloroflexota bacterium]
MTNSPNPTGSPQQPPQDPQKERVKRFLWQGKIAPAFWTVAGVFSIVLNVILIVTVLILGQQLFVLNDIVENSLIGGLYDNFVKMDEATIVTSVTVEDTIPVKFDLPVTTNTTVYLTEPTPIYGASVVINTGGLSINAPADIVLPAGLPLPIALNITVPVDQEVPVVLEVPVNIPLNQTELHEPFTGLQDVVSPFRKMLGDLPNAWLDTPFCKGLLGEACIIIFNIPQP